MMPFAMVFRTWFVRVLWVRLMRMYMGAGMWRGDTRVCGARSRARRDRRAAPRMSTLARDARRVRATTRSRSTARNRDARDDALERADARRDDDDATATRSDEDVDGDGDERAVDDRSIRWDHRR